MHEFDGLNYFIGKFQRFWEDEYHLEYVRILHRYHDQIALISSSHIHRMEIKNEISIDFPLVNITQLVHSSTSPIYTNNPGYGTIELFRSTDQRI